MTNAERVKKSREKNDCITIRPSLELGREIRDAAAAAGVPLTAYITNAVLTQMKKDKRKSKEKTIG